MKRVSRFTAALLLISAIVFTRSYAQDMPPARVVVSEVKSGVIAPQTEFIGTVYYQEISDVASEVTGSLLDGGE